MIEFKSLEEINKYFSENIKSDLFKTSKNVVPGEGNSEAEIMFVGEAPGAREDELGRPFVGPAGKFLDVLLESIDLERDNVFITNVVKCRPPNNRDPSIEEKKIFAPWLKAQIDFINPKVFVPLGRHALCSFLPNVSISSAHGKIFYREKDGRAIFAMYHPAVALYNGSFREILIEDMQNLKKFLNNNDKDVKNPKEGQFRMF
jgi:uracil-DNA glycosylase